MPVTADYLASREERRFDKPKDGRTEFQRDRDRILYSTAFRRLAEVTQVVGAGEGHVFHNRLTHSLEVAQFARRLAERLLREQSDLANGCGLSPDVAEAAGLAHDIGHPPFGHVGEEELDRFVTEEAKVPDGFESNAQSLRVITRLAVNDSLARGKGLCLTRGTQDAILKYPWFRQTSGLKHRKWSVFQTEKDEFNWVRKPRPQGDEETSLEAAIMDWADDVTFAVHDALDFYCAGRIPLDRLASSKDDSERKRFLEDVFTWHDRIGAAIPELEQSALEQAFIDSMEYFQLDQPYQGTTRERGEVRTFSANRIARYIGHETPQTVILEPSKAYGGVTLKVVEQFRKEVMMLKELVWHYVIRNPSLATQQYGTRAIISNLCRVFYDALEHGNLAMLPFSVRDEIAESQQDGKINKELAVRHVVDLVAGMTEQQAISLHSRFTGNSIGSILDRMLD
jgi:dGTPase